MSRTPKIVSNVLPVRGSQASQKIETDSTVRVPPPDSFGESRPSGDASSDKSKASIGPLPQANLWPIVEVPAEVPPLNVVLPSLASQIVDRSVAPAEPDVHKQTAIKDLEFEDLHDAARQISSSGEAICIADIDRAKRAGQAPVDDLDELKLLLLKIQYSAKAEVEVPTPGSTESRFEAGPVAICVKQDTSFTDIRSEGNRMASLTAERKTSLSLEVPEGMIAVAYLEDGARLFQAGKHPVDEMAGAKVRLEVRKSHQDHYQPGEFHEVTLPTREPESVDMTKYVDYRLVADGERLVRAAMMPYGQHEAYSAHLTIRGAALSSMKPRYRAPDFQTLKPGRYTFDVEGLDGPVVLDLYPQRVVKFAIGGGEARLMRGTLFLRGADKDTAWVDIIGPSTFYFNPVDGKFMHSVKGNIVGERTITDQDRTC